MTCLMLRVHVAEGSGFYSCNNTFSVFVCQEVATLVLQEQLMASDDLNNIMVKQQE